MAVRCVCGLEAVIRTSWTNQNPGRRFYGCPTCSLTCVNILRWYDPPMCQRSIQIIPWLLRSRNELEEILTMVEEKRRKFLAAFNIFHSSNCIIHLYINLLYISLFKFKTHIHTYLNFLNPFTFLNPPFSIAAARGFVHLEELVHARGFVHLEELMQTQREAQQANELSNLTRQRQLLASVNYKRAIKEELERLPGNLVTCKTTEHLKRIQKAVFVEVIDLKKELRLQVPS
ncbi:zinc finger, GRF-type containing protein [Tanacetum coccineum]